MCGQAGVANAAPNFSTNAAEQDNSNFPRLMNYELQH
jgi:hypothetical protein